MSSSNPIAIVEIISQGPQGPAGQDGAQGSATVAIGTVTTGNAGTNASVANSGTATAAILDFTIPRGDTGPQGNQGDQGIQGIQGTAGNDGAAATIAVGTVTTGAAGSSAVVTNSGSSSAATFNFTIPKGDTGAQGPAGADGADGGISDGDKGDIVVSNSGSTFTIDNDVVTAAKLADTSVTAGSYTNTNITVDAQGRITAATSGSPGGVTSITGSTPISSSGGSTPTISISAATTSAAGSMSSADKTKLDGIESNATADQTASEIRTLVEAATDSNVFTDADHTKLNNIETAATADQTGAEIKSLYEAESNTNAFTDAEKTKLTGIEASADVTDATNVDAAGAVMNTDTSTAAMSFVIDEDNMASNSATQVPTQQSVKAYVDTEVAGVVDSAPSALNTLNELAAALGDDANFSTTVTNQIGTKLPLAGGTMTGNIVMSGTETVDGRDLSVDGAKLDGIEAGAKDDQTAAEIKTLLQSDKLTVNEIADEAVTLAKLEHGTASNDGKFLRANNGGDPTFETINTNLVADTTPQLGGDLSTNNKDIKFGDGDTTDATLNRLHFGASDDLEIYHASNTTTNYIAAPDGDLEIQADNFKLISHDTAGRAIFLDNANSRLELGFDGNQDAYFSGNGVQFIKNVSIDNEKELRLFEATANGTNYTGLKAASSISTNTTFTLPSADGTATGNLLRTDHSGGLSFTTKIAEDTFGAEITGQLTLYGNTSASRSTGTLQFGTSLIRLAISNSQLSVQAPYGGGSSWSIPFMFGSHEGTNLSGVTFQCSQTITAPTLALERWYYGTANAVHVFKVTVAGKNNNHRYNNPLLGSSLGYRLSNENGNLKDAPFLILCPGSTYRFDQSDSTNSGHPLRFYLEADKTTAYTTNVTTAGTPGSSGAYTEITVTDDTPSILHYQCSAHAYMGNAVSTNSNAVNADRITAGTIPDARFPATLPAVSGANLTDLPGGLAGPGSEELFVEAENQMDANYTTQQNYNYVAASPMTIASGATLTVSTNSTMTFV